MNVHHLINSVIFVLFLPFPSPRWCPDCGILAAQLHVGARPDPCSSFAKLQCFSSARVNSFISTRNQLLFIIRVDLLFIFICVLNSFALFPQCPLWAFTFQPSEKSVAFWGNFKRLIIYTISTKQFFFQHSQYPTSLLFLTVVKMPNCCVSSVAV